MGLGRGGEGTAAGRGPGDGEVNCVGDFKGFGTEDLFEVFAVCRACGVGALVVIFIFLLFLFLLSLLFFSAFLAVFFLFMFLASTA